MKKNELLENWLEEWEKTHSPCKTGEGTSFPREYRAYFFCFNAEQYYEAHDVLEHLWLGCADENRSFYQALIQFAGAFVHLQKQAQFPDHPTHSRRLGPGSRLFDLAAERFRQYPDKHQGLDVAGLLKMCALWKDRAKSDPRPLQNFPHPQLILGAPANVDSDLLNRSEILV